MLENKNVFVLKGQIKDFLIDDLKKKISKIILITH